MKATTSRMLLISLVIVTIYTVTQNLSKIPSHIREDEPYLLSFVIPQKPTKEKIKQYVGLDCSPFNGPEDASEMVFWEDIPADNNYVSPLRSKAPSSPQYLTFEPDEGGFNNIRMALETTVAIALATGRILVLPPKQKMYLLGHEKGQHLSFDDFYHLENIAAKNKGFQIISFEDFLKREAMQGNLKDPTTGQACFPPQNRTNWDGALTNFHSAKYGANAKLWPWLRNCTVPLDFAYTECIAAFPKDGSKANVDSLNTALEEVFQDDQKRRNPSYGLRQQSFDGNPTAVNASVKDRLSEILAHRKSLCVYDEKYQEAKVLHVKGEQTSGTRMLVHFYAFVFFQDWKQDLWTKRFIRDNFRYKDEIQCAAARIVSEMRNISKENGNDDGVFHTAHIRRGDFQYKGESEYLIFSADKYIMFIIPSNDVLRATPRG